MSPAVTYFKLVATMFFWGGTWVAARIAVQEVPPLAAAVWRFLFAFVTLLIVVLWHYRRLLPLTRRELGQVMALGATGIFLYNVCFLFGMRHITAGRGALVVALNPVIVSLGAWLILGEAMTRVKALGVALALVGCLTVIGKGSPLAPLAGDVGVGELLILGCAMLWAAYTLIGRVTMRTLSPLVATTYASLAGWLMLIVTALVHAPGDLAPDYSLRSWAALLFLGLAGTTLGFTWYNQSVQRIGPARAAIFINLVPVAAVLQAAWLLGEWPGPSVLIGGLLVLAGVVLTQSSARKAQA